MFIKVKKWLACYPLVAASLSLSLLMAGGAQARHGAAEKNV